MYKNKSVHTAVGIWAAKEAVSKVPGTGFAGFTVKDIEIHISISHEDKHAMAVAIAE